MGRKYILYVELFLPFGLRTAARIFNLFSEAIHRITEFKGWNLYHYIDDFLMLLPPDKSSYIVKASCNFFNTCEAMRFTIEIKKNKEGILIDFPGLEIDIMVTQARLPKDKHHRVFEKVFYLMEELSVPFYKLEKLLGFLSFCCSVVPLGRFFLQQVFNLLNHKSYHLAYVRITKAAKRDLKMVEGFPGQRAWSCVN